MEEVVKFLKDADVYYLATMDGDQPRVRPFGTAHIFDGRLYIQTGKIKKYLESSIRTQRRKSAPSRMENGFVLVGNFLKTIE